MKRMLLYFGSFNPVHKGHIALAEYAMEHGLADETALIISPQSPYKSDAELAPETDRFEMAEIACKASKYPGRIKPSVVEFLLPRPSYTIDTLRYLEELCGHEMEFSILMGGDQIAALDGWKEYEKILEYPIYVYPRRGERVERFLDAIRCAPRKNGATTPRGCWHRKWPTASAAKGCGRRPDALRRSMRCLPPNRQTRPPCSNGGACTTG